jgi:hypothetical protein
VLFGSTALLDGTPSADTVRLFTYGGLVRNDLRARGDLNFAGDADFDSTVAETRPSPITRARSSRSAAATATTRSTPTS